MTPEQRTAIYSLAAAVGTLLAAFGIVTDTVWAQATALVVSLIATWTAFAHRPTKR